MRACARSRWQEYLWQENKGRVMRVFVLTVVTMVAFAANSVLNRVAIVDGGMDATVFGAIRLVAGAVMLAALVVVQRKGFALGGPVRAIGVASLLTYIFGFSLAYQALDAGIGALVLFGVVQVTMFLVAVLRGEDVPSRRFLGAGIAAVGLVWLLWPSETLQLPLGSVVAMAVSGVGWGVYSLAGQGAKDATQSTAMNFILAAPFGLLALLFVTDMGVITPLGIIMAVISGAVTSGLGYALWYAVLPSLGASRAAVAQLTVPVIAMAGGMLFLSEALTLRFVLSSVLVLGGVWVSTSGGKRKS